MFDADAENLFEEEIMKMDSIINQINSDRDLNIEKKKSIKIIDSKANENYMLVDKKNGNEIDNQHRNNEKNDPINTKTEKSILKKPFTFEEDEILLNLVNSLGDKKDWILISFYMKKYNFNRTSRQCRDRYVHYLDPKIASTSPWTSEEDNLLIKTVEKHGKKWKLMENIFPGRSEVALRNRYHLLLRKMAKNKQNKEKKSNIMSDKFAFLDIFYQNNIKSQKSQRNKSITIDADPKEGNIKKLFNGLDKIAFGDENFMDIDFNDESIFMFE